MEVLLLFIGTAILVSLIIPWVNLARINSLKAENDRLRRILNRIEREKQPLADTANPESTESPQEPVAERAAAPLASPSPTKSDFGQERAPAPTPPKEEFATSPSTVPSTPIATASESPPEKEAAETEKGDWFGKLTVWIGGIALLMAGFFMIRYSIESGWMTPNVRLWLTTIFGVLLCGSGLLIERRVSIRSNRAIGQSLAGAGVACLYFSSYAAVHLYGFISVTTGFAAMVAVTLLAVVLSLRLGVAIALMGLIGGFLTPFLMAGDEPSVVLLLSYTFLVFLGAQILSFLRRSAILLFTSFIGAFGWALFLLLSPLGETGDLGSELLLFLLGIAVTNVAWTVLSQRNENSFFRSPFSRAARWIVWAGILPQGLWALWSVDFSTTALLLYSVIALGALALGCIREKDFGWISLFAFCFVLLGGLVDQNPSFWGHFSWIVVLSLLFGIAAFLRANRSQLPKLWYALSLLATSLCLPVSYLNREVLQNLAAPDPIIWLIAFLLSAVIAIGQAETLRIRKPGQSNETGAFSAVTFFLSAFGLWSYVDYDCFSLWISALVAGAVLLWRWRDRGAFRITIGTLIGLWIVSMTDRISPAIEIFLQGSPMAPRFHSVEIAWGDVMAWFAGFVVICFALTKPVPQNSPQWRSTLSRLAGLIAVATITTLCSTLDSGEPRSVQNTQWMAGVLTSVFAVLGIAFLILRKRWHPGVLISGVCLGIVTFRIVFVHLFSQGAFGDGFFWNALWWQFGIPFLAYLSASWLLLKADAPRRFSTFCLSATMATGWVWATFLIQDYFGSRSLFSSVQTDSEMYAYSAVWLLLAIIYQSIGLWRNLRPLHVGSLILLLLAVAKVFLIDTATLTGLFRVISFFGLGLALLGIGFFYNKVVFSRGKKIP